MPRLLLLLFLLAGLAGSALAQPGRRGAVYAGIGTLATPDLFDRDGRRYDSGVDFAALTAEVGAELAVYRGYGMDGALGAALHLAKVDLEGDGFEGGVATGFEPRNVVVLGRLDGDVLVARAGVFFDLQDRPTDAPGAFTTDGQHAVLLGAGARLPAGRARLGGGLDAFLTFTRDIDGGDRLDDGDVYAVHGEVRYPLGPVEAGLRVQYVAISDVSRTQNGADQTFPDSDSHHIGLIPWVSFRPPGSPLAVTLQAGARSGSVQEYADYGIAVAGRNAPVTHLPLALRARYRF